MPPCCQRQDMIATTPAIGSDCTVGGGATSARRMMPAELLGRHSHRTGDGKEVHIWLRNGKYLARGRHQNRPFGLTLGADESKAEVCLRQLLGDLEEGTFVRRAEARHRPFRNGPPARLSLRELCNAFLCEKRKLRGKKTAQDYTARLTAAIEFAETPANRRKWTWCQDIDRAFAIGYRSHLHSRLVTRNGHFAAWAKAISAGQIHNHLVCLGTVLNWAKRPDVNLLPAWFANPFTHDVVGDRPRKDPLAPPTLPLDLRIALVGAMDRWQLGALALSFVLPNRPEDITGLLISDLDFNRREIQFGTRFGGADYNKGRMSFRSIWPWQLDAILLYLVGDRKTGPLIMRRTVVEGRRRPRATAASASDVKVLFDRSLARAGARDIQADNDRKNAFRRVLRTLGGVDEDALAREFKALLGQVRPGHAAPLYDLRDAATTDMKDAGVDTIFRRYVTGHSLTGEILASYETQSLALHMARYFDHVRPLLDAIARRAGEVGIILG
jgi:hypothetical protein